MKRLAAFVTLLAAIPLFAAANQERPAESPRDELVGVLRVHPKFHYRYYLDGFGDGQQCALFGADEQLERLEPGTRLRVHGRLASRHFAADPNDHAPALAPTWVIYLEVERAEKLKR